MTEIFRCLAGSRLYGTANENSDHDYKAVHLPTKRQILLGKRDQVISRSTGPQDSRNGADDVDVESFELQRFLQLAGDMQTIPVEMLFVADNVTPGHYREVAYGGVWSRILANKDKILNSNQKAFVGYCKGQAVRYSMRGKRLDTFIQVRDLLKAHAGMGIKVDALRTELEQIEGAKFVDKPQPGGRIIPYLDVYNRQVPGTQKVGDAARIYDKPISEAGDRARGARDAGGMDCKALYHAVRIANEGIQLFRDGEIHFPCQDLPLLHQIRGGEVEIDDILDIFDDKITVLEQIGANSPLSEAPDREWINDFVSEVYENVVKA